MTAATIEIVELAPSPVVVLSRRVTRPRLPTEIDRAIRRVETAVTAAQVPVAGVPFVRYLGTGDEMEIEVGVPLAGSHAVPTLRAGLLPGGPAATTWHVGPYSDLAEVVAAMESWIGDHAESAGPFWESYWSAPGTDPPRVQLFWPVRLR